MEHVPVLVERVVELLAPPLEGGGVFVDATLGAAGHARALLEAAPRATLVGIDRDPVALAKARAELAPFGDRARLLRGNFEELASLLERLGAAEVRGVLFDLGVSSSQLDDPARGFAHRFPGPLDMRMDPEQQLTAHEVVNGYAERDLVRVIRSFGEERFAGRVARRIVSARPIESTDRLADVVRTAIPAATRRTGGHPARRTFQALRIEVNRELDSLPPALHAAAGALVQGGRVVTIAYHSLEDRIVKRWVAAESRGCTCPPELAVCRCGAEARLRPLVRRPERPGEREIASNPRARSARLRGAQRLGPGDRGPG